METIIVVTIVLIVLAMAVPNIMQAVYSLRLRTSASDLASLMQQSRMRAEKDNATYAVQFSTQGNVSFAYLDINGNGSFDVGEPVVYMGTEVSFAAGAPSGASGQPTAFTLTGDTGPGYWDNTQTVAFTGRGLPCNYDTTSSPPACATPASRYFVFYLTTSVGGGSSWAGVVVTKGGRSKVVTWNGSSWN